jgi:hypothetical protein
MEDPKSLDEKTASPVDVDVSAGGPELEHGHLQDLEIDVGRVLKDDTIEDIESDTSPYPEGII